MRKSLLALILTCVFAPAVRAETFDNASVIALTRAGLDEAVIVAKVSALPCSYDLTTGALVALRQAGVGQRVIVAMLHQCTGPSRAPGNAGSGPEARHAPGIYLMGEGHALTLLRPTATVGSRTTGIGSLLFPLKTTLTVPQPHAQVVARHARPTFYFYFDPADEKTNTFGTITSWAAQSPNEFTLVRFKTSETSRELAIGRVRPYAQVSGLDPRIALPFTIEEIGAGSFRIGFASDLPAGEYAFMLEGELPRNRVAYRVFDFAVAPPGTSGTSLSPASR